MSSLSTEEISAIEAAFKDHIQGLFKILLKSLADDPQKSVERFAAGIAHSRRAKELARNASVVDASTRVVASRAKRKRTK
jgi:hypothetical protein